jgi:hypothetical protein
MLGKKFKSVFIVFAMFAGIWAFNANAAPINFSGFGMTSSGCAGLAGSSLRLSSADRSCADSGVFFPYGNQGGAAFITDPFVVDDKTSWTASFGFNVIGSGDGFNFVVQNDSRGVDALGGGGHLHGYSSDVGDIRDPISPSFAIEFDKYQNVGQLGNTFLLDPNANHIGLNLNGNANSESTATPGFTINDGQTHSAWIEYDGVNDLLEVFLGSTNSKPASSILSVSLAMFDITGDNAYFGFTGSNGGLTSTQDITSFDLNVSSVPLPAALPLFGTGLAFMGFIGWSRKRKVAAAA